MEDQLLEGSKISFLWDICLPEMKKPLEFQTYFQEKTHFLYFTGVMYLSETLLSKLIK